LKYAVAALGLGLSFGLPAHVAVSQAAPPDGIFAPNAFIRIAPDDTVAVLARRGECAVSDVLLTTIVAQELRAHWSQIRIEPDIANRLMDPPSDERGASNGNGCGPSWDHQYHRAAAMARMMLVAGAAAKWDVPVSEVSVRCGVVRHSRSGLKSTFGPLAPVAAVMPPPAQVVHADRRQICGRPSVQQ
jgi:CO/xanthine dehydrogenase Mo-binding subunit